jgi:hypothetical protein
MSHFTVLVTGQTLDDAYAMLAPYQENNMGDCPPEYMAFHDETETVQDGFIDDTMDCVRGPNGVLYSRYDTQFRNKEGNYRFPDGYEEVTIPVREFYDTEKQYAKKYHGLEWNEEHEGYGYMENPNAKWDWYQLGGRWTGALKLKPDIVKARVEGSLTAIEEVADGSPGLMTAPNDNIERADSCLVCQLDIEWHREEAKRRSGALWDAWHSPLRPCGSDNLTREAYDALPQEKKQEIMEYDREHDLIWLNMDERERLSSNSRDQYIEMFGAPKATTYAFISEDGEWNERAHMGWFGVTWDENTDYDVEFWNWIESLPGDTRIWVFDCHI